MLACFSVRCKRVLVQQMISAPVICHTFCPLICPSSFFFVTTNRYGPAIKRVMPIKPHIGFVLAEGGIMLFVSVIQAHKHQHVTKMMNKT
jgi:hypothetical protein